MAKKASASTRRGKRANVNTGPIVRYTPAQARAPKRPLPDAEIDFSEIPEASDEWLAQAVRERAARLKHLARPAVTRTVVTFRIDRELLAAVRALATARGVKYQSLMQQLLAGAVVRETATTPDEAAALGRQARAVGDAFAALARGAR